MKCVLDNSAIEVFDVVANPNSSYKEGLREGESKMKLNDVWKHVADCEDIPSSMS